MCHQLRILGVQGVQGLLLLRERALQFAAVLLHNEAHHLLLLQLESVNCKLGPLHLLLVAFELDLKIVVLVAGQGLVASVSVAIDHIKRLVELRIDILIEMRRVAHCGLCRNYLFLRLFGRVVVGL